MRSRTAPKCPECGDDRISISRGVEWTVLGQSQCGPSTASCFLCGWRGEERALSRGMTKTLCPNCQSEDVEQTSIGFTPPARDPNTATCHKCSHEWLVADPQGVGVNVPTFNLELLLTRMSSRSVYGAFISMDLAEKEYLIEEFLGVIPIEDRQQLVRRLAERCLPREK